MMKKIVIIALVLFTGISFAQRPSKLEMGKAISKRQGKSPEARAEIQSKQMQLKLDLTKAQQTQVQNVLLKHFTEEKTKRDAIRKSEKKLTKDKKTALKSERLDAQIALKAEMKTILNAEQYSKFSESMEYRKKRRKGKRK